MCPVWKISHMLTLVIRYLSKNKYHLALFNRSHSSDEDWPFGYLDGEQERHLEEVLAS